MEYIDGTDLGAQLKERGTLSPREDIRVGLGVTDALRALNEAGIIHRDVKPANVMIDRDGTVKLTDFGIAKIIGFDTITIDGPAADDDGIRRAGGMGRCVRPTSPTSMRWASCSTSASAALPRSPAITALCTDTTRAHRPTSTRYRLTRRLR